MGTLDLLVKDTLILRPFNLSAAFPRLGGGVGGGMGGWCDVWVGLRNGWMV